MEGTQGKLQEVSRSMDLWIEDPWRGANARGPGALTVVRLETGGVEEPPAEWKSRLMTAGQWRPGSRGAGSRKTLDLEDRICHAPVQW